MKKVTGIGGIFFKCKDPKQMKEWYKTHLGLDTNDYGATFEWADASDPGKKGSTTWSPFSETTKYFEPSTKDFMINYTVSDLEGLVEGRYLELVIGESALRHRHEHFDHVEHVGIFLRAKRLFGV